MPIAPSSTAVLTRLFASSGTSLRAGQEDFSAVRDQYMTAGDGFMCVYSVTFAPTFKEVRKLFEHSLRIKDAEKVPFVIVGNKCDLEDEREVPRAEGEALAQELGCTFMECSAKVPINVDEAFHQVCIRCTILCPIVSLANRLGLFCFVLFLLFAFQLVREIKEWKREFGGEDEPKVGKDGKPKAKGSKCMIV
jgi:Ras family